ncbi:putative O-methyltransferase YrrM [Nocardiopsis sp. Huas11]|uniref:O-methyltransferase n=1 Tax=Nocardiopsis sp. Huas11 TaxID=2183912 RepID=UPI000F2C92B5|nr:hypothetical protein [Nocardiopsis sp. Huas11]RKS06976.1 putative O-methyltransferase YrrM [Nocardiopsis sp. Huas11]
MTGFADGLGDARRAVTAYFGFNLPEERGAGNPEGGDLLDDIGDTVHGAELPVLDRTARPAPARPPGSSDSSDPTGPDEASVTADPADSSASASPESAETSAFDPLVTGRPVALAAIEADTEAIGRTLSCEEPVGRLLRALAAAKPGGRLLELGTGTGAGTAWLLAGMDGQTTLDTVDHDPDALAVARRHHAGDPRLTFHEAEGGPWLAGRAGGPGYDLVFTPPGTSARPDEALALVRRGGFYVLVDRDRRPEAAASDERPPAVGELVADLERAGWIVLPLDRSCGVLVLIRA